MIMDKALSGIRVIDMTHNQAGPACAQILGFLGADVIKLEEPKGGDIARRNMRDRQDSDSLFFLLFNANKRSLTLNLKTGRGKELFKELIARSDVLVENFSPGALDRLGLGWDVLSQINPRLIYATIKGFGSYGPYANYKELRAGSAGDGRRDERDRISGKSADLCRAGNRRLRHRDAYGDRHSRGIAAAPQYRPRPVCRSVDAGRGRQFDPRQPSRPPALWPRDAATRQPNGAGDPEHDLSLRARRSQRLGLHHRAAADVAGHGRSDGPA